MPDEYRVTIRLTPELYAQLAARGTHGQPWAAIVRQALEDYMVRQPEPSPHAASPAMTLAAMAASLEDLRAQVDRAQGTGGECGSRAAASGSHGNRQGAGTR